MKPIGERVPGIYLSRLGLPILIVASAALLDGFGVFMSNDVAHNTPFFSNIVVWFGLAHFFISIILSASLILTTWSWRAEHQLIIAFGLVGVGYLLLSTYFGLVFYSSAPLLVRAIFLSMLLLYHGWHVWHVAHGYEHIWTDDRLRQHLYVEHDSYYLCLRYGEEAIRKKLKMRLFPYNVTIIINLLVGLVSYFYRHELSGYFDANWIPICVAIWGISLSVFVTTHADHVHSGLLFVSSQAHVPDWKTSVSRSSVKACKIVNVSTLLLCPLRCPHALTPRRIVISSIW